VEIEDIARAQKVGHGIQAVRPQVGQVEVLFPVVLVAGFQGEQAALVPALGVEGPGELDGRAGRVVDGHHEDAHGAFLCPEAVPGVPADDQDAAIPQGGQPPLSVRQVHHARSGRGRSGRSVVRCWPLCKKCAGIWQPPARAAD